eukprot:gene6168-12500_t
MQLFRSVLAAARLLSLFRIIVSQLQSGYLTKLSHIDLHGNALTGIIPSSIGYISALEMLLLYQNSLQSFVPTSLCTLSKLRWLYTYLNPQISCYANCLSSIRFLDVTSVYLALAAGFDVLFQDVDLVWMRDPRPLLQAMVHDAVFMDDGARTPRFTPFFANTGFYYLRHNARALHLMERLSRGVSEIGFTHSHQATFNRHLTETQGLLDLKIHVLDSVDFPSGIMFHHNKSFMALLDKHQVQPYVFHMCWTDSRAQKVTYFKQIGMWFIPDNSPSCQDGKAMLLSVTSGEEAQGLLSRWRNKRHKVLDQASASKTKTGLSHNVSIVDRCCLVAPHWK